MFTIIIAIHVIACVGLIFFILIQQGKGGGLIDSFSAAESIFGTKTNTFLTKTTTVLAITFFITCLSLALLSVQQSKSIIQQPTIKQEENETTSTATGVSEKTTKTEQKSDEKSIEETQEKANQEQKDNAVADTKQQN